MSKQNYLSKVLEQGSAVWGALRLVRSDNWQNVFTGLGTSRDKTQFGSFVNLSEVRETELTALYHQSDMARRVVALKPQEMMRKGFAVNVEDDTEASSDIGTTLRKLKAGVHVRDAMIWGRLYGGAAVLIGADDGGEAHEPLNESTIKSVKFLHVIDKRHLVPDTWFADPLNDEHFGEPQTYRVTPRRGATNLVVHRSRMLVFGGAHTSDEERDRLGNWDHSVITAVYAQLRQFDNVWQAAEHLMSDASQAVFKIQGLMSMIAGGQKDVLQTRMQLVDMSRSVARALLLDADGGEEFSRESSSFTDAQAMLDKFMLRLAAAAEVPVTILMGQSPAGMNATGESDFRWFYDSIATAQENELQPQLERQRSRLRDQVRAVVATDPGRASRSRKEARRERQVVYRRRRRVARRDRVVEVPARRLVG
jgi:phage-related protein (TIGR01555 family)